MKVFIVQYESEAGIKWETLLIVRKVYGQPKTAVRRWDEAHGLSKVAEFETENYYMAMEQFMATRDSTYGKMLAAEEVTFQ